MTDKKFLESESFKRLYPFSSRYMKIRGFDCHYVDEGAGEPLVMLHGNPTWSFYFRSLIKGFSDRFRCVAPDHIGCGLSEKPSEGQYDFRLKSRVEDLEDLLDRLGIKENITLVLHDWGGMIGSAFAARHPEKIKRLVILNTAAFFLPGKKKLPVRLKIMRDLTFFAKPAVLYLNLFAISALRMASRKGLPMEVKKGLVAPYDTPKNRLAILKFVQDIPLNASDPSYSTVDYTQKSLYLLKGKPMIICWGTKDFVFDENFLLEWRKRFPEAEIHRFQGAGHYVLEDEPEEVRDRIERFLDTR